MRTRTYNITTPRENGGTACDHAGGKTEEQKCAVNCEYEMNDWGECDSSTGKQTRTFKVLRKAMNGGETCESRIAKSNLDLTRSCDVNCQGEWSDWSACDKNNKQTKTFKVTVPRSRYGDECAATDGAKKTGTVPLTVWAIGRRTKTTAKTEFPATRLATRTVTDLNTLRSPGWQRTMEKPVPKSNNSKKLKNSEMISVALVSKKKIVMWTARKMVVRKI